VCLRLTCGNAATSGLQTAPARIEKPSELSRGQTNREARADGTGSDPVSAGPDLRQRRLTNPRTTTLFRRSEGFKRPCALLEANMTKLIHFGAVKAALGIETNRTLKSLCARHGIPIVTLSPQMKALTAESYALLLQRASVGVRKAA
jgi:hypothetical protein